MAKTIDRALLRKIREDVDAELAALSKKHGVLLFLGNARFTATEANFKLGVKVTDASVIDTVATGAVDSRHASAANDYAAQAKLYGMKPEWLNKQFMHNGSALTVVGLLPNKRKNNVLVMGSGGGKYIMPPSDVIRGFGA